MSKTSIARKRHFKKKFSSLKYDPPKIICSIRVNDKCTSKRDVINPCLCWWCRPIRQIDNKKNSWKKSKFRKEISLASTRKRTDN